MSQCVKDSKNLWYGIDDRKNMAANISNILAIYTVN
jgi:hypothetical protein